MEIKILVNQFIPKEGLQELFNKYYVIMPGKTGFSFAEQMELIRDADVLLSLFNTPVNKDLIEAGKKLKMISTPPSVSQYLPVFTRKPHWGFNAGLPSLYMSTKPFLKHPA